LFETGQWPIFVKNQAMRTIPVRLLLITTVLITVSGYQLPPRSTAYHYTKPIQYNDGLATDELVNVGMDSSRIVELTKRILADSFPNVHSLLIYKDGKLVYENYFAGRDQQHGKRLGYIEHSANQLHDCRSISKSVVSACIGIALQQGLINSIDDPITHYFPELQYCSDSVKKTITIRHLLTMSSGLLWNEIGTYGSPFNPETQMSMRFRPARYILGRSMAAQPGTVWNYNGGNTQLLAEIITRKTGLPIDQFADSYLFKPMGITQYEWVNLVFKKEPSAASGLRLTSRDMLKFGLLYLNKGRWNGIQLLDSNWVAQSFTSRIERKSLGFGIRNGGYGYQFWTYKDSVNAQPVNIVEAKGNGGQSVFVCSAYNLVMVTTAGNYNRPGGNPYAMLTKYVLPAVNNTCNERR
jgi:CubicO group peptidase (beta-lactamase class C family)